MNNSMILHEIEKYFCHFISIEIVTLLLQEVTSALVHIPTYAHLFDKNNVMRSKDCNWWCPAQNIV